jgi:glycosyltransferase involved in cell wall biosynthesis
MLVGTEDGMKIGINGAFWHLPATGSGRYLHHLLDELASLGGTEVALCLPRSAAAIGAGQAQSGAVYPLATPLDALSENLGKLWFEQLAFPRACGRLKVDVAHVPYFAPPLRSPAPLVVTIHDLIPLILPPYRGSLGVRAYMRLVSMAARRASLVLTDSQASAKDIQRLLRIPDSRLRVIYLAASPSYRPLEAAERAEAMARLGVSGPYLLYLGGFDVRKNVIGLLRAYSQVAGRLNGVRLVIAGRLPERDSAFAPDPRIATQESGLGERVHFTGPLAERDAPALYGGALAFVFPSFYEGFGLPVLEALACGTPAIYGSGSSLEEIAGPGGLPVPPDDPGALAEAMVHLVRDDAWRERLALAGLAHAARFSWQETARQTREAYRDALDLA